VNPNSRRLRPQASCEEMICGITPVVGATVFQPLIWAGAVAVVHAADPPEPAGTGLAVAAEDALQAARSAARQTVISGRSARPNVTVMTA
jgi:hypothetical protein